MRYDCLIVGAGFAGSVVAERLAHAGRRVLVVDRRAYWGGNAHDEKDAAGILVHRHGPHLFHTNSDRIVRYLSRFTEWRRYEYRVLTSVDGQLLPFPINLDTVNRLYGLSLTSDELVRWLAERAEPVEQVRTSEEVVVSKVGRELYEKFFRGYTRKQWGLDPSELDASVAGRVRHHVDRDDRYFTDTFQAVPRDGYDALFRRLLTHPNITVELGTDYREVRLTVPHDRLVFTGPVDEYFDWRFGPLPYRSLRFEFETLDVAQHQPAACIHHPNEHAYTRVTEFKHVTGQVHGKTTIMREYPQAEGEPYYPIPRPESAALYERYRRLADATPNVHFVGRLATYRYYNMDQVVAQALTTAERILGQVRAADPHPARAHAGLGGAWAPATVVARAESRDLDG